MKLSFLNLPSAAIIAKFSTRSKPNVVEIKSQTFAAYDRAAYVKRKARNLAAGLNCAGKPRRNPNRKTWPQLKGMNRSDYKREYEKLQKENTSSSIAGNKESFE